MKNSIPEIIIKKGDTNIFNENCNYVIPLYQRSFSWKEEHINQLIDDVLNMESKSKYYIGSLIVSREGDSEEYEVIDGQQRLTTLFLLLNCLDLNVNKTLKFACRDKSNYTLDHIEKIIGGERIESDLLENSIVSGIKVINERIGNDEDIKNELKKNLEKVVIFRIEVPRNTDMNRYFEIMNTRGEQLEQHDILKAQLMNCFNENQIEDKEMFASIWDACSDMTGYVQMHFKSKNNEIRKLIFGNRWSDMPPKKWKDYIKNINVKEEEGNNITDIIAGSATDYEPDGYLEDESRVRFESIIEFPYFLLHTLKVMARIENIKNEEGEEIIPDLLDDKNLVKTFSNILEQGFTKNNKVEAEWFAKTFIVYLIRTRFLFDKYIIKREYINESVEGEWSLKSLDVSGQGSQKKPYYKNSHLGKKGEHTNTVNRKNKLNLMLQSALRVSYTSPRVMHWITELLWWLSINNAKTDISEFETVTEEFIKKAVNENFFQNNNDYKMGVDTPHIVFNYLDYLLWKSDQKKYKEFVFEFRNSVEHWYPRNPSEDTFERWDDVDRFGNLCIIQRNINSKFSNMSPEAKKSTFEKMIGKGSLKLRLMDDNTISNNDWKRQACDIHEKKMIDLLKTNCNVIN